MPETEPGGTFRKHEAIANISRIFGGAMRNGPLTFEQAVNAKTANLSTEERQIALENIHIIRAMSEEQFVL
jgi:hypothetical protein